MPLIITDREKLLDYLVQEGYSATFDNIDSGPFATLKKDEYADVYYTTKDKKFSAPLVKRLIIDTAYKKVRIEL